MPDFARELSLRQSARRAKPSQIRCDYSVSTVHVSPLHTTTRSRPRPRTYHFDRVSKSGKMEFQLSVKGCMASDSADQRHIIGDEHDTENIL